MEKLKEAHGCAKLIVRDGWLICPGCHKRVLRVEPNTAAQNLIVYCRKCMEKLQNRGECGKLIVKDGWLKCPSCRKRLLRVERDTAAHNLIVYCRNCKRSVTVDIDRGQCFESQSPT